MDIWQVALPPPIHIKKEKSFFLMKIFIWQKIYCTDLINVHVYYNIVLILIRNLNITKSTI